MIAAMFRKSGLMIVLLSFMTGSLSYGFLPHSAIWHKNSRGIYESDIRTILIDPTDDARIYAGTSKALYKSTDGGKSYHIILRASGKERGVNAVYISHDQPSMIYAATDAGLYESRNAGKDWNRIYYSSNRESRRCLSIIRYDQLIYLGTEKGLFRKTDQETNWRKIKNGIDNRPVYHIVQDKNSLYLATGQILFNLNKETYKIQKIFSLGIGENRGENSVSDEAFIIREDPVIRFIAVSSAPRSDLLVASSKGVYFSSNRGEQWQRLLTNNLALEDLTSLVILENHGAGDEDCPQNPLGCLGILAGTKKGVFFLNNGKWMPLYKGIETNEISYLAKNTRGTVYAATARGIFTLPTQEALPSFNKSPGQQVITSQGYTGNYLSQFDHEPNINEVHQLAIDYAEVSHEKIKNWRVLARRKALMPDLSVGLDRDASDLFHWNTGANPDELQKGRDLLDWDVSLSWDLADLVWSTDQTTIDSRSKLMVELREDILNEVTRLYFERRRIQVELVSNGLLGPQLKMDKDMRVAELTALIDALTGGEFSKRITKNNKKRAVSHQSSVED